MKPINPFQEQLDYIMMKARFCSDDPVILTYLLRQIKELHKKEDEKMSDQTKNFIQQEVDRLFKELPVLIRKKKLELKGAR